VRVLNVAAVVAIAVLMALDLDDLLTYLHGPGDYHFGSEVAGFRYHSPRHFVGSTVVMLLIGALGLAGPLPLRSRRAVVACRVGVALGLLALSFTLSRKWAVTEGARIPATGRRRLRPSCVRNILNSR